MMQRPEHTPMWLHKHFVPCYHLQHFKYILFYFHLPSKNITKITFDYIIQHFRIKMQSYRSILKLPAWKVPTSWRDAQQYAHIAEGSTQLDIINCSRTILYHGVEHMWITRLHDSNGYLLATVLFMMWNVVGSFAALAVASAKMDIILRSGWLANKCSCNKQFIISNTIHLPGRGLNPWCQD